MAADSYIQERADSPALEQPDRSDLGLPKSFREPGPIVHARRGRPRITLRKLEMTPIELERWLETLSISKKHFARMTGTSRPVIQDMLAGKRDIPRRLAAFLEIYTQWEETVRKYRPIAEMKELVWEFVRAQPKAVAAEVIADRLRLPIGVVLEIVEKLQGEGALG